MMSSRIQAKERDVDEMYSTTADKMNDEVDPGLLNINLENFEEPGFEDSKYVLTSPRSLAACTALGIKPMELLYKPLVEYQEELLPQGFPLRVCYEVFDQQEKERLNKLALCREERFRLISDEESNGEESPKWMPHAVRKSPKVPRKNVKIQDDGDAGMLLVANGDKPANKASLERQRTAWATSVGHHRVTRAEVKQRALEIFEAGQKLRDEALSGGTGTRRRPNKPGSARGRQGRARSADTWTRRQRPHSAGSTGTGRQKKQERQRKRQERERANSFSDVSSVDSARSSRSPWAAKDPAVEAKPITNVKLRKTLTSAKGARLSPKDQKILEIMMQKREAEAKAAAERDAARAAWESQRRTTSAAKNSTEKNRRQSLMEERKQRQLQRAQSDSYRFGTPRAGRSRVGSRSGSQESLTGGDVNHNHAPDCPGDTGCSCGRNHDAASARDVETSRRLSASRRRLLSEEEPHCCDRDHAGMSHKQFALKQQELEEKRRRELERKKSVESRLEQQRREEEEYKAALLAKSARDLRRANSMKTTREQEIAMKTKLRNEQAMKRHEEKMNKIKRQSTENLRGLQTEIERKQAIAELKLKSDKHKESETEAKLKRSKETQKKLDEELASWRNELLTYREMQEKRAEEAAKKTVEEKKRQAAEERRRKEQLQKQNMRKMLAAEEEWKHDVEATIAMKDARTKMLQMEKDAMIEESRQYAQASQKLREELRQHYSMNDLDKLNRQAQLEAKIVNRQLSNMNIS